MECVISMQRKCYIILSKFLTLISLKVPSGEQSNTCKNISQQGCVLLLGVSLSVYLIGGNNHDADVDEVNPGLKYIDPSVALVSIAIVIVSSRTIARESCFILLQTIPAHLDVAGLKEELFQRFPDSVLNVHDMHIWCLVPGNVVVTMHVIFQSKEASWLATVKKNVPSGVVFFWEPGDSRVPDGTFKLASLTNSASNM